MVRYLVIDGLIESKQNGHTICSQQNSQVKGHKYYHMTTPLNLEYDNCHILLLVLNTCSMCTTVSNTLPKEFDQVSLHYSDPRQFLTVSYYVGFREDPK